MLLNTDDENSLFADQAVRGLIFNFYFKATGVIRSFLPKL